MPHQGMCPLDVLLCKRITTRDSCNALKESGLVDRLVNAPWLQSDRACPAAREIATLRCLSGPLGHPSQRSHQRGSRLLVGPAAVAWLLPVCQVKELCPDNRGSMHSHCEDFARCNVHAMPSAIDCFTTTA